MSEREHKTIVALRMVSEILEETNGALSVVAHELNLAEDEVLQQRGLLETGDVLHKNLLNERERLQAEVERLREENTNLKYDAKQDTFMRHYTELRTTLGFQSGVSHSNVIQYTKMLLDYKEELKKEVDSLKLKCKRIEDESKKRLDDILAAHDTIKSREAEAKSYRGLYNELRESVLKDLNLGNKSVDAHSPKEVLHELKGIKNSAKWSKESAIEYADKLRQAENKYRRLVDLLKRSLPESNYGWLLNAHRENEKKLKRGKK